MRERSDGGLMLATCAPQSFRFDTKLQFLTSNPNFRQPLPDIALVERNRN